jgi:peptide/nickel transport system substrate-binding protein
MPDLADQPNQQPENIQPTIDNQGKSSDPVQKNTNNPLSVNQAPPPINRKNSRKRLFLCLVLILIIAGLGLAAAKHFKKDSSTQAGVVKKDVPLLRVNYPGGEVPQYPVSILASSSDLNIASQMFEGLVQYQDQTKVVPLLATSWTNPNATTWIFNLRKGVKFHSGHEMTSADVKFSLDYALAHQNDDDGNSVLLYSDGIKQVDATGQYQVTIITDSPDPVLLSQLSLLFIVDSKAKLGDYNAGTGPYVVKPGTQPANESIDLQAVNDYWGGHVYTKEVRISFEPDESKQFQGIQAGKYDLAGDFNKSETNSIKNNHPIVVQDQGLNYMGMNTEKVNSPLSELAGRQAAVYALDIPKVLEAADVNGEQASQLVPKLLPGHDPSIPITLHDLNKAKQLLSTTKNPNTLLTFAYSSGSQHSATAMIKQLIDAGFNVTGVPLDDFGQYLVDSTAGKYDFFIFAETSNYVDGQDILSSILVGNKDYVNSKIDSLISEVGSTFDPKTRIRKMQEVAKIVYDERPVIPLYTRSRSFALTKPYVVKVDMPSIVSSIYFWKVYQK